MRLLLFLIAFALLAPHANAQANWALKTNLTDLAVGRDSVGVERMLDANWSLGMDLDVVSKDSFMESNHPWFLSQNAHKRGLILQPQLRWYPAGNGMFGAYVSLDGFFGYARYRFEAPEEITIASPEWSAVGASLHVGRQVTLGRLLLDGFIGGTWANDSRHSIYQESTALFPPPSGLRISGGLRLGLLFGHD